MGVSSSWTASPFSCVWIPWLASAQGSLSLGPYFGPQMSSHTLQPHWTGLAVWVNCGLWFTLTLAGLLLSDNLLLVLLLAYVSISNARQLASSSTPIPGRKRIRLSGKQARCFVDLAASASSNAFVFWSHVLFYLWRPEVDIWCLTIAFHLIF